MQIQKPASAVSQQIQSFKANGYSHLEASPYSDRLSLKEVIVRTDRLLLMLPGAIREASEGNRWKTDDRYDPPTEQVAAQIDREGHRLQRRANLINGSVASMGLGAAGGILTATAGLPGWVGVASAVVGVGGFACAFWHATVPEVLSGKEVRQTAQDLRDWGSLT